MSHRLSIRGFKPTLVRGYNAAPGRTTPVSYTLQTEVRHGPADAKGRLMTITMTPREAADLMMDLSRSVPGFGGSNDKPATDGGADQRKADPTADRLIVRSPQRYWRTVGSQRVYEELGIYDGWVILKPQVPGGHLLTVPESQLIVVHPQAKLGDPHE